MKRLLQLFMKSTFLLVVYVPMAHAQILNEADFYTPPTSFNVTKNLVSDYNVDNSFDTDDSQQLQQAIDEVSAAGGGELIIPEGSYSFAEVLLKSNVHLSIDSKVVIRPSTRPNATKNYAIFRLGNDNETVMNNVSIVGVNGQFTVDLRQANNSRMRCFQSINLNNFLLANIKVLDNQSTFAAIEFNGTVVNRQAYGSVNGVIKNIDVFNAEYGYGVMQMHYGRNLYFKDIYGLGGTTLRFESHTKNYYDTDHLNFIDKVYGRNITCENGNSALMLSPHFIKNGVVDVRDITSIGAGFAVRIDPGFVSDAEAALGLTPGFFGPQTTIKDIKASFSNDKAQIHPKHFKFLSCNLRGFLPDYYEWKWLNGPSIGGVLYQSNYPVQFQDSDVTEHTGFQNSQIVLRQEDAIGLKNCPNETLSINEVTSLGNNNVQIFPNPAVDKINISVPNSKLYKSVEIINKLGKALISVEIESNQDLVEIPILGYLASDLYFVKLNGKEKSETFKVIVK